MSLFKFSFSTLKGSLLLFSLLSSMMTIILFIAYIDVDSLANLQAISANRWHMLPVDNWIPKFFADAILNENIKSPLFGSWLSSDRPPLQTGFYLIFTIFSHNHLIYLVTSVGMQLLVIVYLIIFLSRYIKDNIFLFFVTILIFFNGFVFVHSLFVWPKLLSALYQGLAFYYIYKLWLSKDKLIEYYILFGVSSILAFLSHGAAVFYLLAVSFLLLFTVKNKKDIYKLFYGFLFAVILYLPWILYQRLIDPPGDRLLKWHLAAQIDVTDDTIFEALITYYDNLSLLEWGTLQFSHLERIYYSLYFDITNIDIMTKKHFLDTVFFSLDYSFLFFSIVLSVLYVFVKKTTYNMRILILLLLSSYILYTMIWSLLLASSTIIHQGAYFAWFSGFLSITLIVYAFNRYVFYVLGLLNLSVFIMVYLEPHLFHRDIINSTIVTLMIGIFLATIIHFQRYENTKLKLDSKKYINSMS